MHANGKLPIHLPTLEIIRNKKFDKTLRCLVELGQFSLAISPYPFILSQQGMNRPQMTVVITVIRIIFSLLFFRLIISKKTTHSNFNLKHMFISSVPQMIMTFRGMYLSLLNKNECKHIPFLHSLLIVYLLSSLICLKRDFSNVKESYLSEFDF